MDEITRKLMDYDHYLEDFYGSTICDEAFEKWAKINHPGEYK